jgi:hypothetical protein
MPSECLKNQKQSMLRAPSPARHPPPLHVDGGPDVPVDQDVVSRQWGLGSSVVVKDVGGADHVGMRLGGLHEVAVADEVLRAC